MFPRQLHSIPRPWRRRGEDPPLPVCALLLAREATSHKPWYTVSLLIP
jgi:hypothetical protein